MNHYEIDVTVEIAEIVTIANDESEQQAIEWAVEEMLQTYPEAAHVKVNFVELVKECLT